MQLAGYPRSPDLNGPIAEGVGHMQLSQRAGVRCSSARGYLSKRSPNLELMLEAEVLRIDFDGLRATGVSVRMLGERKSVQARNGVVLTAGALNTPRLLMLSGVVPHDELSRLGIPVVRHLPGVGCNRQEHPGCHLVNEVSARTLNNDAAGARGALQVLKPAFGRRGALTTGYWDWPRSGFTTHRTGPAGPLSANFGPSEGKTTNRSILPVRSAPLVQQ